MQPDTTPFREAPAPITCADCGGDLDGNRWRCPPCIDAAHAAINAAGGAVVRPSDVARAREAADAP